MESLSKIIVAENIAVLNDHEISAQRIAQAWPREQINHYYQLAYANVRKAFTALLAGLALLAFAGALPFLAEQLMTHKLTSLAALPANFWVAQCSFALVGLYLAFQGVRFFPEAKAQRKVMIRALSLVTEQSG